MSANLKYSAVATGLEKVSFHSKPKEGQCQRMFKLPDNCTHFICYQGNTQNSPSYSSTVPRTENSQMYKLDLEKAEEPEIKLSTPMDHRKKQENARKTSTSASMTTLKPLTVCCCCCC